jgi:transcriptional regulator with XRE-family HTH domain
MTFADRLKLALSEIPGATQADLARACQVKSSSCSAWFSGESDSMRASVMLRAAKFLDVTPTWLVFGTGPMRGASEQTREITGLCSIPTSDSSRFDKKRSKN